MTIVEERQRRTRLLIARRERRLINCVVAKREDSGTRDILRRRIPDDLLNDLRVRLTRVGSMEMAGTTVGR